MGKQKTSRGDERFSAARRLVALVDNDAAVLHAHESATAVHALVRRSAIRPVRGQPPGGTVSWTGVPKLVGTGPSLATL